MEELHRDAPLLNKVDEILSKEQSLLLIEAITRGGRTTLSKKMVKKLREKWECVIYANCRLLQLWNQYMRENSMENFCKAIMLWFMAQHDVLPENTESEMGKLIWHVKNIVSQAIEAEEHAPGIFPNSTDVQLQTSDNIAKIERWWEIIWKKIGENLKYYLEGTLELPPWSLKDAFVQQQISYLNEAIVAGKDDFVINFKKTDVYFTAHREYLNSNKHFSTIQAEFEHKLKEEGLFTIIDEYGKGIDKGVVLVLSSLQRLHKSPSFIDFEWLISWKYANIKLVMGDFLYEEDSFGWIEKEVPDKDIRYTLKPLSLQEVCSIPEIASWEDSIKKELFNTTGWRLVEISHIIDSIHKKDIQYPEYQDIEDTVNATIDEFCHNDVNLAQYGFLGPYIVKKWIGGKEIWEAWRQGISADKKDSIKNLDLFVNLGLFEYTSVWNIRVRWDILREAILRYRQRLCCDEW